MGIEERKLREREEKRDLILKTAMQLFIEKGINNVSIRGIAEKIEYSPATIYLYFKDKGEILHELHTQGFEKLFSLQRTLDYIKDPLEKLNQMGRLYIKFALENPDHYDLMFIAKGVAEKIFEKQEWDVGNRSFQYLRDNIKDCIEQGYIVDADIDSATFAAWSLVHGMAALIIRGRCVMLPGEFVDHVVQGGLKFFINSMTIKKQQLK
ncbi:MAG TPA: TetR/AcrR family transcriptional regulator [Ignavibacteria bacterium]|jgi:AcrR family transcriptional regulator